MITKAKADHCQTHHAACDCREYRAQVIERTLTMIRNMCREELQRIGHNEPLIEDIHRMAGNALSQ